MLIFASEFVLRLKICDIKVYCSRGNNQMDIMRHRFRFPKHGKCSSFTEPQTPKNCPQIVLKFKSTMELHATDSSPCGVLIRARYTAWRQIDFTPLRDDRVTGEGPSKITNYSTGADCHSTLGCVRALGIDVAEEGTTVTIQGRGLEGWNKPRAISTQAIPVRRFA